MFYMIRTINKHPNILGPNTIKALRITEVKQSPLYFPANIYL